MSAINEHEEKPQRMCVICRRRFHKMALMRFISDTEGKTKADPRQLLPGRGYYCCSDPLCLAKFASYRPKKKAGIGVKGTGSQGGLYDGRQNKG